MEDGQTPTELKREQSEPSNLGQNGLDVATEGSKQGTPVVESGATAL